MYFVVLYYRCFLAVVQGFYDHIISEHNRTSFHSCFVLVQEHSCALLSDCSVHTGISRFQLLVTLVGNEQIKPERS